MGFFTQYPHVYLIRHGKTARNGESDGADRIRGWDDVPLTEAGRDDAKKAAQALKGTKPIFIYSSDLVRASDTAKIIWKKLAIGGRDGLSTALIIDQDLRPWNLGEYHEKLTVNVLPELNHHIRNENEPIQGGEPFREFRTRFLKKFKKILDRCEQEQGNILVVVHYRNVAIAEAWNRKGRPEDLSIDVDKMTSKCHVEPGEFVIYSPDISPKKKEESHAQKSAPHA